MTSIVLRNIIRFMALILFQVLIISNVHLQVSFYINPYVYPLIILLLPMQMPKWAVILASFFTGIAIDTFLNTAGFHAASCVLIGYLRPYILQLLTPRNGYEADDQPTIKYFGFTWFITYATLMLLIHHLIYFFIEVHAFNEIGRTLFKIILSLLFSLLFILLIEVIASPVSKKKYEYN